MLHSAETVSTGQTQDQEGNVVFYFLINYHEM